MPEPNTASSADGWAEDAGAELADERAPSAPVTPWNSVPSLEADPGIATPPRVIHSRREEGDSEPEPTIVGRVPENLLELSGTREENTRAFTAPRELLELARRQREDRDIQRSGLDARAAVATGRGAQGPETARAVVTETGGEQESMSAPSVPIDSELPMRAASPVPVPGAISRNPKTAAQPARRDGPQRPAPSAPDIEIELPSDSSPSVQRAVAVALRPEVSAGAEPLPSGLRRSTPTLTWLLAVGLFVIVGILLTRWKDIIALFH